MTDTSEAQGQALAPPSCSLLLGDCLEMMREIPDGSVDMVCADLPYGTTQCKWDSVIPLEPLWAEYKRVCKPSAAIVLTASQPFTSALVMSNPKWFKYEWVWQKTQAVGHLNAYRRPMVGHESVAVFYDRQCTYNPQIEDKPAKDIRPHSKSGKTACYGDYKCDQSKHRKISLGKKLPTSCIKFANPQKTIHPTQKPLGLMEYLIRTYTNEGETVLDNTMGSGTTGVAAMNEGRHFIGIEKDADFFRVASERIYSAND